MKIAVSYAGIDDADSAVTNYIGSLYFIFHYSGWF